MGSRRAVITGDWITLADIVRELFARVINSETSFSEMLSDIAVVISDLDLSESNIVWLESDVDTNTSDIGILKSDVTINASHIAALGGGATTSDIDVNTSDIVILKSDLQANASNLVTGDSNIQVELDAVSDVAVANASDITAVDLDLQNYLAIDGTHVMTGPVVFGTAPVDTDGNWRLRHDGTDLLIEVRISGSWKIKFKFQAS